LEEAGMIRQAACLRHPQKIETLAIETIDASLRQERNVNEL
jgi:hypothetical protein